MTKIYSPVGVNVALTHTTPQFEVGTRASGDDGTEWVYIRANGAISQYHFVGIDETWSEAASLTSAMADDGWSIGAVQVAFADNEYGWAVCRGNIATGTYDASTAADSVLHTSATAGQLQSLTSVGTKIDGIVLPVAAGTSVGTALEVIMTHVRSGTF